MNKFFEKTLNRQNKYLRGLLLLASLALPAFSGSATLLTKEEMYFDPDSLVLDIYDRDYLSPLVNALNVVSGNIISWGNGITDVDILPMLNPVSGSDPAGYPIGYSFTSDDYYYAPMFDYFVDVTAGIATATFNKAGIYHARLTRADGTTEIRAVMANAGTLGTDTRTAASVPINGPVADYVLVSQPTGGDATLEKAKDNAVDDNGENKVGRASSVADAVNKIKQAYEDNGKKKIHLEIVAHGNAGYFELGDTPIGAGSATSIKDFQELIDEYVNEISVYACSFAADGGVALQTLANSIGKATGYDKPISVYRDWFGLSSGWDLSLRGAKLSAAVPEPSTALLFVLGLLFCRKTMNAHTAKGL